MHLEYPEQSNVFLNLWCMLLSSFMIIRYYRNNVTHFNPDANLPWKGLAFLLFVFAQTTFWNTDFFSYIDWISNADVHFLFDNTRGSEVGWQFVASLIHGEYFGFRIICWGTSIILFIATCKRLKLNIQHSLFILVCFFLTDFCYARATCAQAIYFYGLSFLLTKSGKLASINGIVNTSLGCGIIMLAPLFHRSIVVLIALTPLLFVFRLGSLSKRWILIVSLLLFGGIYFMGDLLYSVQTNDEILQYKLGQYSSVEMGYKGTLYGNILLLISRCRVFVPLLIMWVSIFKRDVLSTRQTMELYIFTLTIIIVALSLYIQNPKANYSLYYRILIMAQIPFSLTLCRLHEENIISYKSFIWCIYMALGYFIFNHGIQTLIQVLNSSSL